MDKKSTITQQDILEQMRYITWANHTPKDEALFRAAVEAMSVTDAEAYLDTLFPTTCAYKLVERWVTQMEESEVFDHTPHEDLMYENSPVKVLLEQYNGNNSLVADKAKREMFIRFPYLVRNEQVAIMKALLRKEQVYKWGRHRCYTLLKQWWDREIKEAVIALWNTYHEEECGLILIKHLTTDELHPLAKSLIPTKNYYKLCIKCMGEPWFKLNTDMLKKHCTEVETLEVISLTPQGITPEEAHRWIYLDVADRFLNQDTSYYIHFVPMVMDIFDMSYKMFYLHKTEPVRNILARLCSMGFHDIVAQFLDHEVKVCKQFKAKEYKQLDMAANMFFGGKSPIQDINNAFEKIFKDFLCYFALHIPEPFQHIADPFLKKNHIRREDGEINVEKEELTPEVKGFISEFKGTIDYILEDTDKHNLDEEDYSFIDLPF